MDYTQYIDTIVFQYIDTLIVYLHSPQPKNEVTIYGPGVYSGVEFKPVAPSKLIPSKNFYILCDWITNTVLNGIFAFGEIPF